MKRLVLYHASCPDGAGAALAALQKLGDVDVTYKAVKYGTPFPFDLIEGVAEVYVLDFSFRADVLREVAARVNKLVVIDHHKTARDDLEQAARTTNIEVVFNLNHSGAVLAWRYFNPDTLAPQMFEYLEDRDLWLWKMPFSKEISAALYVSGGTKDFRKWSPLFVEWQQDRVPVLQRLIVSGRAVLLSDEIQQSKIVENAYEVEWEVEGRVYRALASNSPLHQSEAGNLLAEESKKRGLDSFGVVWFFDGKVGKYRLSFRSVGGFDVGQICKLYGGGGHSAAAGCEVLWLPWATKVK